MTRDEAKKRDPGTLLGVASTLCEVFALAFDTAIAVSSSYGPQILALQDAEPLKSWEGIAAAVLRLRLEDGQ